jgi:hypothetical protein
VKRTILILLTAVATAHAGWKIYDGNSWRASLPDILHLRVLTEKQLEGSMGAWHNTVFESEDKSVSLSVYTHPLDPENELQTLHAFFEAEVTGRTDEKDVINYTFIKDNWYVVSGTNFKGFEFYTKLWRYNDHGVTFNFAYPPSKRKVYEPMLLELLRNFTPNLPGEWDY